ncbi:low temperature requirement protein A [Occultella kanbiaonis]|uniref:low temperature requirement protein A n=1 Tax=Occultella kanbiaonis TaxID=2675754 RepID=UPI0013D78A92|nr:low temperature requirement protein A [Occultella kanbiaonis]
MDGPVTRGTWGMRTNVLRRGQGHDSNRVGYIELFFDLVFVFAVTQLSHSLITHPDLTTLGHTLILAAAVWYMWIDTTWVTNWLDPERLPVRALLITMMLFGLVMSGAIPEAFGPKALLFAVTFVTIQVGRSLFTVFALARHWPVNAVNFARITIWLAVSGVFWIAGALVGDDRLQLALWALAVVIDYCGPRAMFRVPVLGATDPATWTVRGEHMAERVGLFMIITLGESIIITGSAFAELDLAPVTVAAFLAAFASTVLMWLLYFDRAEGRATAYFAGSERTGMIAQTGYTYVPLLMVLGIVGTAVADELVLLHPMGHDGVGHADPWTAGLICGAAAVFLVGNVLFRRATGRAWSRPHLAGVAALALLYAAHVVLTPLALNWISNAVLLGVLCWDLAGTDDAVGTAPEPTSDR